MPQVISSPFVIFDYSSGKIYHWSKRCFDIVFSFVLLFIFLVPVCLIWVAIKLSSDGPVIFQQQRGGLNGRIFVLYKFRTMHHHLCDEGLKQVSEQDPRLTPFGQWLRRRSLDEIPQLWNVLRGDMSLIGPRPHSVAMDHYYRNYISFYDDRYKVKPGLTGYAQVKGHRGETRLIEDMQQRVMIDLDYIHHQCLWLDLKIFFKSVALFICDFL